MAVGEIERHHEQTEPENIFEVRPANRPLQIASQNALIAPQIFTYGVHAWITSSHGASTTAKELIIVYFKRPILASMRWL